jgi:hypothetical protein
MEKQRIGTKIRIGVGLLIFAVLPVNIISPQTYSEMHLLRVTPHDKVLYSGKVCEFVLIVPDVKSSDVEIETPVLPSNVNFVSMRRTDYIAKGELSGTEVDLWLTFCSAEQYSLPPLGIKVRNRLYSIPFDKVTVVQDPSTLTPCFIIRFDNGIEADNTQRIDTPLFAVSAGDKIRFTVFVQYAVQVMNFEWSVPKDTLLTEIQKYEITGGNSRSKESFMERIPVGRFEWQPLVPGFASLPEIHFTATAYSGSHVMLSPPDLHITVLRVEKKTTASVDRDENYFTRAFSEVESTEIDKVRSEVSESDCEKLALLRTNERHSFFQWKAAAERRSFEKKIGIAEGQKEPDMPMFFVLVAGTAVVALFTLVLIVQKKRRGAFTGTAVVCILLFSIFVFGIHISAVYGIFKGGSIHSVPDESSGCVSLAEKGQRVRIEEVAGKWIYIQYGNTGGWISSSSVIIIK